MRAILFDLDGTLLDIRLDEFLRDYFGALSEAATDAFPGLDVVAAVSASTEAMMRPHAGLTNKEAFDADFLQRTGHDIREHADTFERFYAERFPLLANGAAPAKGGRRAVETALDLGFQVAIATNPIFPIAAVRHRLTWAGLDDIDVRVVTAYEDMHSTKPLASYFRETAELLGVEPGDSMMVGDDPVLDLAAADIGMRTFYVGSQDDVFADYRGDLDDLADLLPRLAEDR